MSVKKQSPHSSDKILCRNTFVWHWHLIIWLLYCGLFFFFYCYSRIDKEVCVIDLKGSRHFTNAMWLFKDFVVYATTCTVQSMLLWRWLTEFYRLLWVHCYFFLFFVFSNQNAVKMCNCAVSWYLRKFSRCSFVFYWNYFSTLDYPLQFFDWQLRMSGVFWFHTVLLFVIFLVIIPKWCMSQSTL